MSSTTHGFVTLNAMTARQLWKNAVAFQSTDAGRPELGLTQIEVGLASDGRVVLRTVSTDSYKMLVQKFVVKPHETPHMPFSGPITLDAGALLKATPARRGDVSLDLDGTFVEVELGGYEPDVLTVGDKVFPKWSQLFVEPVGFDTDTVYGLAPAALAALGAVDDPAGLLLAWCQCSTKGSAESSYRPVQFSAIVGASSQWSAVALVMPHRPHTGLSIDESRTLIDYMKEMDA